MQLFGCVQESSFGQFILALREALQTSINQQATYLSIGSRRNGGIGLGVLATIGNAVF